MSVVKVIRWAEHQLPESDIGLQVWCFCAWIKCQGVIWQLLEFQWPPFLFRARGGVVQTSRQVAGSIPDGVIGIFQWHNPSGRTMVLGLTQLLTEMSTRCISSAVIGGRRVGLTTLPLYINYQLDALLFIRKILLSCTCFEHQVLIFRRT